jgi:serine/threonine-protein kinase
MLEIDEELLEERLAVGSYRLISRLGLGGMGEVWRATHRLLARPAAVKLIRQQVEPGEAHDQLVRRFEREAQVTARLRSPHTVQLYDFGVNDTGTFYYVMELLQGLDLQDIVNRFGPQVPERVIEILRQTCRSLGEAHDHGLVHRDIKPANLFVARLGNEYDYVKVLDFGIVKDQPGSEGHDTQGSTLLSAPNLLKGTPAFMAPEVFLGEQPIDGRADLYSLACTAYWALTGRLVFQANSPAQMLLHHVQTRPPLPSEVSELPFPRDLEIVLMQCLEKDPAKRPSSALELETMLSRVRCQEPWTEVRAGGRRTRRKSPERSRTTRDARIVTTLGAIQSDANRPASAVDLNQRSAALDRPLDLALGNCALNGATLDIDRPRACSHIVRYRRPRLKSSGRHHWNLLSRSKDDSVDLVR